LFPDGQATYATHDGGWILVSNCEAPASVGGGAAAIRFDRRGRIENAYRILGGTNGNCSGGATPWGTWLSCEEIDVGQVWECDPRGRRKAVARPAMGIFKHEAAAVDPRGKRVYLTEDQQDGGLYRFTPARWPRLSRGRLEIATVKQHGAVRWREVPDPSAGETPTRKQVPGSTQFARGEGIWFDSGVVYVATTSDNRVHAYDTRRRKLAVIYDAASLADPPLTGVDNITVSRSGDLYVCEDNREDDLDLVLITPRRRLARFLTATGPKHKGSELAGVVFAPRGRRLYVASQRYGGTGAVFEITGPFRR
jgi:secreted PhoX family phosphatase